MSTPSILSAIQKLLSLLTNEEKWKWVRMIGFALVTSILEVTTAYIIVIFAQVLNQPEIGQKYLSQMGLVDNLPAASIVLYIAIGCGVIYLIKNLIASIEVFYQNFSIQKMNYDFKNQLLHRYAEADYGFYLTRNSSLGMQVVGGDVEQMFSSGMVSLASILSEGIIFFCLIMMLVIMNPSLALIIFGVATVLSLIVCKGLLPQFYKWGQKLQEAALCCAQNLLQFFHAFKEIILLNKREAFVNVYQIYSWKKARIQAVQTATNALPRMVIEVLFVGLFVISVAYLCVEQESPIQMIGILGGYLYAGFRLMPGLNRIINQLNTFKYIIPSIERVHNEFNILILNDNYLNVPNFSFQKSVKFKNISFRYPNAEKDALSHINLEINKGECIGIVGETGSGKSTLIDVLLGLLKPYEGTVLIDEQYPANSYQWHQNIGYVPQAVYLIDDTIEANIAFGEKIIDIDYKRLNNAINNAQLSNFIKQLPKGVKTFVGERGIRLSGGERQRIAIARALYKNPEVIIFDEATSALDNETETRLMETIRAVSKNHTVIMVAHRLTTLRDCSQILVIEEGNIKQITDYKNLQNVKTEKL